MSHGVLPVGAFVHLFRELLESDGFYSDLWLEGEVSDTSRSTAGHTYFNLRDQDGTLKCALFRNQALRQSHLPVPGVRVAVHGGLSVYPRSGAVQLIVDLIQPAGVGVAALELEHLRQRLEAEGLFEPTRKRSLPKWPRSIGVVTSQYGAAWQDIHNVIARRYPLVALVLAHAQVQGAGAPASIVRALSQVQYDRQVDLIILARGGGDSEELNAFDDERVVRAVFGSRVPIVTGIGHATDATLAEQAADAFAPTPSAAAEISVPSMPSILQDVRELRNGLQETIWELIADARAANRSAKRELARQSPQLDIQVRRDELGRTKGRMHELVANDIHEHRRRWATADALLRVLAPIAVLDRGYAALQSSIDGTAILDSANVQPGDRLIAVLRDGSFEAMVNEGGPSGRSTAETLASP